MNIQMREADDQLSIIENFKSKEENVQRDSLLKLEEVCEALGPERINEELLPMLVDHFEELDDDEKFVNFVEAFAKVNLIDLCGGADHLDSILDLLFVLLIQEENLVRSKTQALLQKFSERLSEQNLDGLFDLANRLFAQESIPSKSSACMLMPVCYQIILNTPAKGNDEKILLIFNEILQDDTAFNRKNIAENIKDIFELLKKLKAREEDKRQRADKQLELLGKLFLSDSDTVRNSCQECFLVACEAKLVSITEIQKRITKGFKDQSWRVRQEICDKIFLIMDGLDQPTNEAVAKEYVTLLTDPEVEVQSACIDNLYKVIKQSPAAARKQVYQNINSLSTCGNAHLRAVLAQNVFKISESIGKKDTIDEILPVCLAMLRDENNQVKLELIKEVVKLDKIIGVDVINEKITSQLWDMAQDRNWRVKLEVVKQLPSLAGALGPEFVDRLQKETLDWMNDSVCAVREETQNIICQLLSMYRDYEEILFSKVKEQLETGNFYKRANTMKMMTKILDRHPHLESKQVPLIFKQADDPVPNVKIIVLKWMSDAQELRKKQKNEFNGFAQKFSNDTDEDVKQFAKSQMEKF